MVELAMQETFPLVSEAPSRTMTRTVFTGRRCHLFYQYPLGDEDSTYRTIPNVREGNLYVRRVSRVNGHTL